MVHTAAAGQEKQSFEQYFSQYYQQVYRYLLKKVSSPQTAEDLAMDAFAVCWQKWAAFDPERASFATWLYVVVNNRLKNHYRDRRIWEEMDENLGVLEDFEDALLTAACLDSLRDALHDALESLPPVTREIVVRRYFRNQSAEEIGRAVGASPGSVRVQLSRALKKMKAYFQEHDIRWEN